MPSQLEIERLVVRLMGDASQYLKELEKARKNTDTAVQRIGERLQRIGQGMRNMGSRLTLTLTTPIVAFAAASVKAFADFDLAMTESMSIMGDLTDEMKTKLRSTALELSKTSVQTPTEIAKSYYYLASAGLDAQASLEALPIVMKFATAGAFDMARATDLLTDAQSALGLAVKDNSLANQEAMKNLSDMFVKTATLANATVEQFSESITNTAGAALKSINKPASEGLAVLAVFADKGVKGQVAGTMLSRALNVLQKSALEAADAHKMLGFEVFDPVTGKMKHMGDIANQLTSLMAGMSDEMKALTYDLLGIDVRVVNTLKLLEGAGDQIYSYEEKVKSAGGTTEDVAKRQLQAAYNQWKLLKNELTTIAIEIGGSLLPMLQRLTAAVQKMIKWWQGLSQAQKESYIKMALWVAAAGPLLRIAGSLTSVIGSLAIAFSKLWKAISGLSAVTGVTSLFKQIAVGSALARAGLIGLAAAAIYAVIKLTNLEERLYKLTDAYKKTQQIISQAEKGKKFVYAKAGVATDVEFEYKHMQFKKHLEAAKASGLEGKELEDYMDKVKAGDYKAVPEKALGEYEKVREGLPKEEEVVPKYTKEQLEQMKRQEEAKEKLKEVTAELNKQIETFGKSELEIQRWELQMMGLSEEMLQEFDRATRELERKREEKKAADDAMEKADRLKRELISSRENVVSMRDVAEAGSAEAATRYDEYMFRIRQGQKELPQESKTEARLRDIADNTKKLVEAADRPATSYEEHQMYRMTNEVGVIQ